MWGRKSWWETNGGVVPESWMMSADLISIAPRWQTSFHARSRVAPQSRDDFAPHANDGPSHRPAIPATAAELRVGPALPHHAARGRHESLPRRAGAPPHPLSRGTTAPAGRRSVLVYVAAAGARRDGCGDARALRPAAASVSCQPRQHRQRPTDADASGAGPAQAAAPGGRGVRCTRGHGYGGAACCDRFAVVLRVATDLRLFSFDGRPLTLANGRTLGTLVGCGSLPMLREIYIEGDECGDGGMVLLAVGLRRGGLPLLGTLRLASSQIGEQAASALAAALTKRAVPALTTLHLGDNELGDLGLVALAPALRQLPTLTELKMWDNEISDRGLAALIAQPMTGVLESLQLLDLRGNDITDAGCAALSSALRSGALPALKAVDLRDDEDDGFSPAHEDMFAARAGLVAFYELL